MNTLDLIQNKIENNELGEALDLIESNEGEYSRNSYFWNLKGVLFISMSEYKTGKSFLEKAISLNKENGFAYYNLAYVYEMLGDKKRLIIYMVFLLV
ncbi:hypothetical protein Q75_13470 [Bacillus coahuilensis p1.1.43]|uniref:Uncharacterized protein n=1 Tax=Bacillus coahuilensis p1.1.43 TaxID=1150625 RepID=A0A147K605_9BACI|nr:tetratricopeptide repeat protein [Bacillus coahuilensis]KUP05254.1 hypothetical protein Q75_13470 [Bacillus coahuilensis p1.1.43]